LFDVQITLLPKPVEGFQVETLDGEVVLLHPARNIILHSNETATLILKLCNGQNTVEDIIRILGAAYPDARAQIKNDVPETIRKLMEQGVLDGN
jgi:coenzyme PQQ biosynthesis protein PqqD